MTSTEHQGLSVLFPTFTHVHDDASVSPEPSDTGYPLGTSVDVGRVVHVGDVVRFSVRGSDPRGRALTWWLHPDGEAPSTRIVGTEVELDWTVGPESIGPDQALHIRMAADATYHREGGPGMQGWDGWVSYRFIVSA